MVVHEHLRISPIIVICKKCVSVSVLSLKSQVSKDFPAIFFLKKKRKAELLLSKLRINE